MIEELDRGNFRLLLAAFVERDDLTIRDVSEAMGCPEAALNRVLAGQTLPSDEMLRQGGILLGLGYRRYAALTAAERGELSEKIGAVGGGALGFGSITAAISTLGVPGLSAAGISSGLAALGSLVGGGMLLGVTVAAAIPLVAGAAGYAIIKAVRYFTSKQHLDSTHLDPRWEIPLSP